MQKNNAPETKNVRLSLEAFHTLKAAKESGEFFSDTVLRVCKDANLYVLRGEKSVLPYTGDVGASKPETLGDIAVKAKAFMREIGITPKTWEAAFEILRLREKRIGSDPKRPYAKPLDKTKTAKTLMLVAGCVITFYLLLPAIETLLAGLF